MTKQWWSCQVDKETAEKYKRYFRENDIYFEPSEAYDLIHIQFKADDDDMKALDKWIKKELFK